MSLALKWGQDSKSTSEGFIYFDAVTSFVETHKGQVTSHPISKGGLISDHFIKDNPVYTFTGIISGVDISSKNKPVDYEDNVRPTNMRRTPTAVRIQDNSSIFKRIPIIGQFFNPSVPMISMDSQSSEVIMKVKKQLTSLFQDGNMQLCRLYEYENGKIITVTNNLVVTSIVFEKDTEAIDVLNCDITLEQVDFSELKKETIPEEQRKLMLDQSKVAKSLEVAASEESNEGTPSSTSGRLVRDRNEKRAEQERVELGYEITSMSKVNYE